MKYYKAQLLFFIIMTISFSKPKLPSGWYYPTEKDNVGTWKEYKKQTNNNPFHFKADFNGDQKEDEAWLLLRTNKNEYGLFVFLMKTDSTFEILQLQMDTTDEYRIRLCISKVEPGKYRTA